MTTVRIIVSNDQGKTLAKEDYEVEFTEVNNVQALKLANGLATHIHDELQIILNNEE